MTVHKFVEANTFQSLPVSNIAGQSPHGYLLNGKFIYKIVDFPVPCFSTRVSESLFVKKKNPVTCQGWDNRITSHPEEIWHGPSKKTIKKGGPNMVWPFWPLGNCRIIIGHYIILATM